MDQEKIYYNTEYRKRIKVLSKFNIFIKDRLSKKDEIQEVRLKKKKKKYIPLLYTNLYNLYKLIEIVNNTCIYKKDYDLKISFSSFFLKKKERKINFFFKNQLIMEYILNGVIYFFLLINWLWTNEWNKWTSFTNIIEYNFFNILILFRYINNYFSDFLNYFNKKYNIILNDFLYNLMYIENSINIYNIYALNDLKIFSVLYNIEEIKFEHDKSITPKNKWKDIKKVSFDYFILNILNDYYYLSFFSFSIYEFYMGLNNNYNIHFITLTFFEYWISIIIEKNVSKYNAFKTKKKKKTLKFDFYNLKNIHIKIYKKKFFPIRANLNLFLSNIDYFIFLKGLTFNFYIRNCDYFFGFISQRKLFLRYNNPTSVNKGSLTLFFYDKLYKKLLIFYRNDINKFFNLLDTERFEPFFNYYYRSNNGLNYILSLFYKNFDLKFLYKLNTSKTFFFSINKFFDFNLIDFYNLKSKLDSYKNVMAINSVYEYRYANSSFKTMEEFMLTIFKTPLENYTFFNDFYKEFSYNISFKIYNNIHKIFFFQDLYNNDSNLRLKFLFLLFKYFNRLFKMSIYFFKFYFLHDLIKNEKDESILKIDVYSRFYSFFEKKKIYDLLYKLKRKDFYKRWSVTRFFNILKNNTMFYLDVYSMLIFLSGWLYETSFFFRSIIFVKIYNKMLKTYNFLDNYKYLMSFKDFYFQLVSENFEYSLILIIFYINKIKINNNINFINIKNKINNNYIYRKYMLYTWLEHNYYNDLFRDLKFFMKENYSIKLSKWILRYFYKKAELHMFYSESLRNNYVDKKRLFL